MGKYKGVSSESVYFRVTENNHVEFTIPNSFLYKFEEITKLKDGTPAISQLNFNTYEVSFFEVRIISKVLKSIGLSADTSELKEKFGVPVYDMSVGQAFLRDEQYDFMKQIMRYFCGGVQLPTGYGKATMMTYLVLVSLVRPGNILVMAPTYSIVEELAERLRMYNIEVSTNYDPEFRVLAVNPVGLMSSRRLENPELIEWMKGCSMVMLDEGQEINNSQKELLEKYLSHVLYRFSWSATMDKFTGLNLTDFKSLNKLTPETFRILRYFGPAIVYKAPQRKIRVVDTIIPFGNYKNLWSYDKCINHLCHHHLMPRYIERCIEDNNKDEKSAIIFPFTNRAHVSHLLEEKSLFKYHLIMWTASGIKHNRNLPEEKGAGLERVKELINNHEVDLMFCTSVGYKGVDISGFRSVMFMTSSSYGMVTQILGRAFRYKGRGLVNVYIARCLGDNPLYNASYWRRRKMLLENNEHILEIHQWGSLKEEQDDLFSE